MRTSDRHGNSFSAVSPRHDLASAPGKDPISGPTFDNLVHLMARHVKDGWRDKYGSSALFDSFQQAHIDRGTLLALLDKARYALTEDMHQPNGQGDLDCDACDFLTLTEGLGSL